MKFSKKKSAQQIVEILKLKGISDVVITPGSRNAPLTIAFTEDSFFNCYSVVDERSAAFFALGMSQQSSKLTVVVGTSGSALLNYYPAVAEAFYSNTPLLIISADRPQKWIDQSDGQIIRQFGALDKHILKSVNLSENEDDDNLWFNSRQINEVLNLAVCKQGPVHINISFGEPLYQTQDQATENLRYKNIEIAKSRAQLEISEIEESAKLWNSSSKKLVIVGSHKKDENLQIQLNKLAEDPSVLIFCESTSNLYNPKFVNSVDLLISNFTEEQNCLLAPEILLTLGSNIVSKRIKMLLRRFKFEHWHIGSEIIAPDTYKNLSRVFNVDSDMFFSQLFFVSKTVESNYASYFLNLYRTKKQKHNQFVQDCDFSDLKVFGFLAGNMPDNIQIQSANSSVVRYFQLFDLKQNQEFFCNRGTSGIEGSTSTSIGAAVKSQKPVLLVSGDLSFFYDSNGLWNNYIPNNFKIVLINNGGGSIFKIIPGPDTSASFDTFFKAEHKLNAKNLAEMYSFGYTRVDREKDLPLAFERFIKNNKQAQILEINTSKFENEKILEDYWNYLAV